VTENLAVFDELIAQLTTDLRELEAARDSATNDAARAYIDNLILDTGQ
jgi:hypothetical protein